MKEDKAKCKICKDIVIEAECYPIYTAEVDEEIKDKIDNEKNKGT